VGHFVGLIWFDKTGTAIEKVDGAQSFNDFDIMRKLMVISHGSHNSYRIDRGIVPRARVDLREGIIIISVGANAGDGMIDSIKEYMGLDDYNCIEISRDPYLDRRVGE
jgi:hypothetical protein